MSIDRDVADFLNSQGALVVEPSNAFFSVIQSCLTSFGMEGKRILFANTYKDAVTLLKTEKPKILITEYMIGKQFGLSLVEMHDELFDSLARISIMVTKESSDNAVAEAAEEQLDAFLLKPFSGADFQKRILEVVKRKMYPSEYFQRIREGKEQIKAKNLMKAMEIFKSAKALNPTPTLACYYVGECLLTKGDIAGARREFTEGRGYNNLHYKCLTGEFDCLMQEKSYRPAYELVELIRTHFPVTSVRLGKFFIAAVYTENFQDLPSFYEMYTNLDYRPPELVNLVSIAVLTAGRFYMRKKNKEEAIKYFEMTMSVSGRNMDFLSKIIEELLKVQDVANAEKFFKQTRADDVGSPEYVQLNFKIGCFTFTPEVALEVGRKIIVDGKTSPEITKKVVQLAIDNGKLTLAESLILKGASAHPEIRKELYNLLEASTAKSSGGN
jgi:CheY-like chemotaxis protein